MAKYGMSLDLFRFSLIPFSNILQFSAQEFYPCFVNFTPQVFHFLWIVNGSVFRQSLLLYRNGVDFSVDSYPTILLSSFISSRGFRSIFLEIFTLTIMLPENRDASIFCFPICMPFIYTFCLTALARTSSMILYNSALSGHFCLVPDLRGKHSVFTIFEFLYIYFDK